MTLPGTTAKANANASTNSAVGLAQAALAGALGSLASAIAKISLGYLKQPILTTAPVQSLERWARIGALVLLFTGCNVLMTLAMARALRASPNTVRPTAVAMAAGIVATAALGRVVFGDELPPQFGVGLALILVGTVLLNN